MVKKIIILAIIGMIFLTGCERINDDGGGSEMTPDVNFDWNNTVRVLQMALGGT